MNAIIHAIGFTADAKLEEYINQKLAKLDRYNDRIIAADIYLKLENSGQVKDKIVEMKVHIPGQKIFVEDSHKTFEASFDKALDSLKRQLKKANEILKSK